MDKIEILEELKRKIYNKVESRDYVKHDLVAIVEESFGKLGGTLEESKCNYPRLMGFLEDSKNEVLSYVNIMDQRRKEDTIVQINHGLDLIRNEINEGKVLKDEENRKKLVPLHDSDKDSTTFMEVLSENLKNVKNRVNNMLENIGYENKQIEELDDEINHLISSIEKGNSEKVQDKLRFDELDEYTEIINEYENVKDDLLKIKIAQDHENSAPKGDFKEGLNANISLYDQNAFATKLAEENEKGKEENQKDGQLRGLPDDIIF